MPRLGGLGGRLHRSVDWSWLAAPVSPVAAAGDQIGGGMPQIRHLAIKHFRGIRSLVWTVGGQVACLVGPGDSTKSTILEAIGMALSPSWRVGVDDSDFYGADTTQPIVIVATVGALPDELLSDHRYGLLSRGWGADAKLRDEPAANREAVLSVEFRVDASLEPQWRVINDRHPDGKPIRASDRARFGALHVGAYFDRHLAWGRDSALSRLTGEADDLAGVLAEAGRVARSSIDPSALPLLQRAAAKVQEAGASLGVTPRDRYHPHLDVLSVKVGTGGLSLHDGQVPLRRAGAGTRRLLTLAVQKELAQAGAILLLDEVEYGLEPHRVRWMLEALRSAVRSDEPGAGPGSRGQIFMTTHSSVVVEELDAGDLRVVRSDGSTTVVHSVPGSLQGTVKKVSGALLGRKILVVEGQTELGLCRYFDRRWASADGSFAYKGVALCLGGGQEAPSRAIALRSLGYEVAYLGDSDDPSLSPTPAEIREAGIEVFVWSGDLALEERLALDLPWEGVVEMLQLAAEARTEIGIRDSIAHQLGLPAAALSLPFETWCSADAPGEAPLRDAVGWVAKGRGKGNKEAWFKSVPLGDRLGEVLARYVPQLAATDVGRKLSGLRAWTRLDG